MVIAVQTYTSLAVRGSSCRIQIIQAKCKESNWHMFSFYSCRLCAVMRCWGSGAWLRVLRAPGGTRHCAGSAIQSQFSVEPSGFFPLILCWQLKHHLWFSARLCAKGCIGGHSLSTYRCTTQARGDQGSGLAAWLVFSLRIRLLRAQQSAWVAFQPAPVPSLLLMQTMGSSTWWHMLGLLSLVQSRTRLNCLFH